MRANQREPLRDQCMIEQFIVPGKRSVAQLTLGWEIEVNMAGEPYDLVASNTVGIELGVAPCNIIEVAGLARHIPMCTC